MKEPELGDDLPSMRASRDDGFEPVRPQPQRTAGAALRADPPSQPAPRSNSALWALCAALSLALVALGYWTYQQQTLLKQQLVATQTSFARISEEASGRIQDITGKVSATESTLSEAEQARNARIGKLENQLVELQKTLGDHDGRLSNANEGNAGLNKRLQSQQTELAALTDSSAATDKRIDEQAQRLDSLAEQAKAAATELTELQGQLAGLTQLQQQLTEQSSQLASQKQALQALQQKGSGDVAQSLLIMRTELDQRTAATEQALDAINSFRLQTNRSINTLQTQLANLHSQVQGN